MLKIVLVGAPSSGKSDLAAAIRDTLGYQIVDDYIGDIEERSDNTLGHFASYLGNLQAAIGRWEAERHASEGRANDQVASVTCGSIIETVVYNGIQALVQARIDEEDDSPRRAQNDRRASISMIMLGVLVGDTWDYDHAFYLPLPDEALEENKLVDRYLMETAESLGLGLTTLPLTTESQLPVVLQEVLENEKAQQHSVRASDSSSEEEGLQGSEGPHDGVPDVQDTA